MDKNKKKTKILSLDFDFAHEVEVLCDIVQTNFATKAKELIFQWKVEELKNLENKAPELFLKYKEELNKHKK